MSEITTTKPLHGETVNGLLIRRTGGRRILGTHKAPKTFGPDKIVDTFSAGFPDYPGVRAFQLIDILWVNEDERLPLPEVAAKRDKAPQLLLVSLGGIAIVSSVLGYNEGTEVKVASSVQPHTEVYVYDEPQFNGDKRLTPEMLLNRHLVRLEQVAINPRHPLEQLSAENIVRELLARAQAATNGLYD